MKIPFIYGKTVEGGHFINRNDEIKNLQLNFVSNLNTVLISPRRWGKSSLVIRAAAELKKSNPKIRLCFIDLYSVRDEEEFYQVLAREMLKATSNKWEEWISNGKKFISKLIPKFTIGIDPYNDFNVSFDWDDLKLNGEEILNLPEKIAMDKGIQIVVCIDEFQNISHFEEPLVIQKKMRSAWQKHQSCSYCLYGSKRHMLSEIFETKSMPFYKFGDTIFIDKIDESHWVKYIRKQFEKSGKQISAHQSKTIAKRMDNHPYFVQMYAAAVWKATTKVCKDAVLDEALDDILLQYAMMYHKEVDGLTNKQLNYLKALIEGVVQFSSKHTLRKYNLGSQGNIRTMRLALEQKEILDFWGKKIEFLDPLFKIWLKNKYFK